MKNVTKTVQAICANCKVPFEVSIYQVDNQKCCSRKCGYAHRKAQTLQKKLDTYPTKVCPVCDKEFTPGLVRGSNPDQIYCSVGCKRVAHSIKGKSADDLTIQQAAYLAGIIDGEGNLVLYMRNEGIKIRMDVTNTKPQLIEWLRSITDVGHIIQVKRISTKHVNSQIWQAHGDSAASIAYQILPYLVIKQRQAELLLETHRRIQDPKLKMDKVWQNAFKAEMHRLNQKGISDTPPTTIERQTRRGRGIQPGDFSVRRLTDTESAYLAAIIDGEGTIRLNRSRLGLNARLSAVNSKSALIDWLVNTTGVGTITTMERKSEKWATAWI